MVHQGDIYYKTHPLDTAAALRLTDSARPGVIYNGVPDWLYEGKSNTASLNPTVVLPLTIIVAVNAWSKEFSATLQYYIYIQIVHSPHSAGELCSVEIFWFYYLP